MNDYANCLKNRLFSIIDEMEKNELEKFVLHPGKDFIRNRRFPFSSTMQCILSLGSSSLSNELLKFFQFRPDFPSVSAFVQQRQKILPNAFYELFRRFNDAESTVRLFQGYRLLAIDGSDMICPLNTREPHAFPDSKCSILHFNALFDVINKQYVDAIIQSKYQTDETGAAVTMVDRVSDRFPIIFLADRGYENYNLFAHVEEQLFDYVIRIRNSNKLTMVSGLHLPEAQAFDITKEVVITRHSTGPHAVNPQKYKYMTKQARFDFIPDSKHPDYEMVIRFVSFPLDTGEYEILATSLPEELFPVDTLKELYHLRWGIESSFREIKHTVGLAAFHSKKADCIIQEIYARLIMYNFSMLIANQIHISEKTQRQHKYLINVSQAIRICMDYFRQKNNSPPLDLQALLPRFILPERKGRRYSRTVRSQGVRAFNYRLT